MAKRKYFGTDGIRGKANTPPMTAEMALRLGQAAGTVFKEKSSMRPSVVIGKDPRLSGYMLEEFFKLSSSLYFLQVPSTSARMFYISPSKSLSKLYEYLLYYYLFLDRLRSSFSCFSIW